MRYSLDKLTQFALSDESGLYAIAAAPGKNEVTLKLGSGVSVDVTFAQLGVKKVKEGAKLRFSPEGELTGIVNPPKAKKVDEDAKGRGEGSCKIRQQRM